MNNNSNNIKNKKTGFRKFAIFIVVISLIAIASGIGIMYFSKDQSSDKTSKNDSSNNKTSKEKWYEKVDMSNKKDSWVSWLFYNNVTNLPIKSTDIFDNFTTDVMEQPVTDFLNNSLEPSKSKKYIVRETGKSKNGTIDIIVENNSDSNLTVKQCIENGWIDIITEAASSNSHQFIPGDFLDIDSPSNYDFDDTSLINKQFNEILSKEGSPSIIYAGLDLGTTTSEGSGEVIYEYDNYTIVFLVSGSTNVDYITHIYYYNKDSWDKEKDSFGNSWTIKKQ